MDALDGLDGRPHADSQNQLVALRLGTATAADMKGVRPVSTVTPGRVSASRTQLSIAQVCEELNVSRSTVYDWRAKGKAPRCIKLPNGEIRVRRDELDRWLASCEEVA